MTNSNITTICIPTCNRPDTINKTLSDIVDNLNKYGHTPHILIIEDSDNQEVVNKVKSCILEIQKNFSGKIEIVDRNDRKLFAEKLSKEKNIPLEILDFAICGNKISPTTIGSARNTFILKTRGEKIMMADDDMVCNFVTWKDKKEVNFTMDNPFSFIFLNDTDPLPDSLEPIDIDIISLFKDTLSKTSQEVLGNDCPEYLREYVISDTYIGWYGDSAMSSHVPLLTSPQIYSDLQHISEEKYNKIKNTTKIVQAPTMPLLYQGQVSMGTIRGKDNSLHVPPFFSVCRGEDTIFGGIKWQSYPTHLSMFLDILSGHKRPVSEKRSAVYDIVSQTTTVSRIINSFILELGLKDIDPHKNIEKLGEHFISITDQPDQLFALFIEAQCRKRTKMLGSHLENLIINNPHMPAFWIKDIKKMRDECLSPNPELFLNDVTTDNSGSGNKIAIFKEWLSLYGKLLVNWKKLID